MVLRQAVRHVLITEGMVRSYVRNIRINQHGDLRFRNALYFSVGTFTTVGYGDWHPVGRYRYAAMVEGLVGWLIMGLFPVTLGKVWIR